MAGQLPLVNSADELEALILDIGMLPFVNCAVQDFSLQACTPKGRWFVRGVEGPWEWRETVAERGIIAYGKLFDHKAGFVSLACYQDLANWRRAGMDFDERYESGLVRLKEKQVMDLLRAQGGSMLSRDLRAQLNKKGLDTAIASLQMRTDIVIRQLEYRRDAFGRTYGMGVARLAISEHAFGEAFVCARYGDDPETSYARLARRIRVRFPTASDEAVERLLRR